MCVYKFRGGITCASLWKLFYINLCGVDALGSLLELISLLIVAFICVGNLEFVLFGFTCEEEVKIRWDATLLA